jgi:NitT/TauT family transport system ATP-binding protein
MVTTHLSVRNLRVSFVQGKRQHLAVEDVSFDVAKGQKLILLGPSGCGKSTLLKTVAGFIKPERGEVLLNGARVKGPGLDRVVVFQEFDQLLPWLTVYGNISFALKAAKAGPSKEIHERVTKYLNLVGLERFADFYPHTLSGGMKQRVAIARALALDPEILLMDEPFGSLDAQTRMVMQEELLHLWEKTGKTIIFVTHSIDEAVILGDSIVILTEGPCTVKRIIDNKTAAVPIYQESPVFLDTCREIRSLLQAAAY